MTTIVTTTTILCACGCGNTREAYDNKGRYPRFIAGHQNTKRNLPHWTDQKLIECVCGCGQSFLKYDDHRRPRRSIPGHITKKVGLMNSGACSKIGIAIKPRLIRQRGRDKLAFHYKQNDIPFQCAINDAYCKQSNAVKVKTRIHYKDHNPYNISLNNLILLCPLHHFVARKIEDWQEPQSLKQLVDLATHRFRYVNKRRKWRVWASHAEDRPSFSSIEDDLTLNTVDNWRNNRL